MAFSVTGTAGIYASSFIEAVPGQYSLATHTLPSLSPQGSFQDANIGFPNVVALHDLGLPGTPAFSTGDITGLSLSVYNAASGVVELRQVDEHGMVSPIYIGGLEVDQGSLGFIVEGISGYVELAGGKYLGTPNPSSILLFSTAPLNTFDAAGNPITPTVTTPATFTPIFGAAAVPEPSMGLMLGLGIVAVVAMRAVFGRARAV